MKVEVLRQFKMSFELTQSLNMPVFHGNVVRGLILAALYGQYASPLDDEHHLPLGLVLVPCESGRTLFAAGDRYQIGITCLSKEAESAVRHLAERVASIGRTIDLIDGPLPVLGGNYVDVVWEELRPVDIFEQINKVQHNGVTLQFVSPLKMRTPDEYAKKIPLMGSACFPVTHFFKQVWSGVNKLIPVAPYAQMPPVHSVEIVDKCFVQIETPLWGGQGGAASHKRKKIIGVQGHVTFANVPKDWVPLLVLGQYSHVGGNRAYGFGRYVLHGLEDDAYALRPSRSVLDAVQADGLLKAAFTHVAASSEASGVDNVTPDDYQQRFAYYTGRLCAALHQNTYTAQPLRGFLLEKANGKQRPMAIPTVEDRMLQRAVATQMTPLLEQLFEHNSYGYRPGRSRAQAAETIDRARREGYTHVVDADIRSFFDCVPWKPLLAKVQALYPFDPVVALVEQWITSPVQYNGAILKRSQGLPQGASISPLLANLYLDEFDDALIAANYAIVRYADDFLILCKSKQEAEQARQAAEAALQQLNLQLSPEKTVIATYDRGFSYLGYLFCRSLVVEKKKSGTPMNVLSDESAAPASSQSDVPFGRGASFEQDAWLAQATIRPLAKRNDMPPQGKADSQTVHSFREMAALFAQNDLPEFVPPEPVRARVVTPAPSIPESLHASVSNAESAVPVGCNESGEDMPGKRPLYLLSPRTGLYLSNAALVVVPDDIKAGATAFFKKTTDAVDKSEASAAILSDAEKDGVRTIPLRAISHVVVVGRPRITMPCVLALIERNIPVYFCKRTGDLLLAAHPAQGQWNMWAEQASAVQNTSVCLHLAQQTLSAKVHNQGIVLRRLGETRAIKEMFSLRDTIADTPCINSLRGIEGTAARLYWESVTQFLPEWVCFTGRKKRPSPDPVNALLSYGYTLLHNHISTKLQCAGLHPKLGFMHAGYGSHHAFASDMQEEFRHIVDSMVFSMFRRKEVRPEHLIWEKDALRPCLLRNSLLRTVTRNFEKRILTLQGSEQSCAAVVLDRQVGCCKQTLLRGVPYVGWRLLK